jgi:hypothetical protein
LFASAGWCPDQLGLVLLDRITAVLVAADTPIVLAVDDTLWRRTGREIHGTAWHHDGAGPGRHRPPGVTAGWWSASSATHRCCGGRAACRSWPAYGSPASATTPRLVLARELVDLVVAHVGDRRVDLVGDAASIGTPQ